MVLVLFMRRRETQLGQPGRGGSFSRQVHQPPRQSMPPESRTHRGFAEIEAIRLPGQKNAGYGLASLHNAPNFFGRRMGGHALDREAMHRRGRVDPPVHIGERILDEFQDRREIGVAASPAEGKPGAEAV